MKNQETKKIVKNLVIVAGGYFLHTRFIIK